MRILFLGAGALGGYFGGRMTAGGADVVMLVRPARAAALAGGLRIKSPIGDANVAVRTITAEDPAESFDVIVLTNKAYGLDGALQAIKPYIGAQTAIVPLLNGLAHYARIEEALPGVPVLGGIAHIPAEMLADGSILHRGQLQRMTVGLREGQAHLKPKAEALREAAAAGGIDARFAKDIQQEMWNKWVFLTALAAGTTLMRADVGTICRTTHGIAVLERMLGECLAVAEASDQSPDDRQRQFYREQLLNPEGDFRASMLVDMEAGSPTEANHILGDMIRRAQHHKLATPMLESALTQLEVYETTRG